MITWIDWLLFGILPYTALLLFFVVSILRYRRAKFTFTSHSTQFLENRHHFWALVPFHYGLFLVLIGHLVGLLVPRAVLAWNSVPLRLWILEGTALIGGLLALIGFVGILVRRFESTRLRVVTGRMDRVLYLVLLVQIASGVWVAIFNGWGSSWYAAVAAPYITSVFTLDPQVALLAPMPLSVRIHVASAWVLIGLFPFTRLVHVLVMPNHYLWRRPQVVRWLRRRGEAAR